MVGTGKVFAEGTNFWAKTCDRWYILFVIEDNYRLSTIDLLRYSVYGFFYMSWVKVDR